MDENSDNSSAIAPAESGLRQADRCAIGSGAGQLNNHGVRSSLRLRLKSDGASTATEEGTLRLLVSLPSIPSSHDATGTTGAVATRLAPAPGIAGPPLSSQQSRDLDSAAVARQNEDVEMDEASGDAVRALGSTESESEGDAENGADGEEMWDLKRVLEAGQITAPNAQLCNTIDPERCGLNACSIWASTLAPEEPWYSCLDCQAKDFEGWGDAKDPSFPLKVLSDELRQAMLDKCTRFRELREQEMPDLPSVPGGVLPSMAHAALAAGVEAAAAAANEVDTASDDEGDWELKKIFDCRALAKAEPQMCQTALCDLQACSKWVAQHDTENPWFSCVDCQEKDYQGWPTDPDALPIKHLPPGQGKMIAERCSKKDKPAMPNLPQRLPLQYQTLDGKLISEMSKDKTFWTDEIILKMGKQQLKAVKRHVNLAEVKTETKIEHLIRHIREWRSGKRKETGFPAEHRSKRMKKAYEEGELQSLELAHKSLHNGDDITQEQFFATAPPVGLLLETMAIGIPATPDELTNSLLELMGYEMEIPAVGGNSAAKRLERKIASWNFVRDPRGKGNLRKAQVWYHPEFDPKHPARPLHKLSEKEKEDVLALFYTK